MQTIIPVDIEDALRIDLKRAADLGGFSFGISAPPIPADLGNTLPYVVVERIGGMRESLVVDTHDIGIDVWADEWGEATLAANKVLGLLCGLPYSDDPQVEYLGVEINALPYNNPDPNHQDIPRVSFTAHVKARAEII